MTVSPAHEMTVFFGSILSGVIMGIIYDVFLKIKWHFKSNSVLLGVGDVVTWIVMSVFAYISVYYLNDGIVRWYEIFGIMAGFGIYSIMFREYFLLLLAKFEKLILFIFKIILLALKPVINLIKCIFKISKKVFFIIKKPVFYLSKKKYNLFCKIKYIFHKI